MQTAVFQGLSNGFLIVTALGIITGLIGVQFNEDEVYPQATYNQCTLGIRYADTAKSSSKTFR